jgi:uncharacterized protein (UPF0332 family)
MHADLLSQAASLAKIDRKKPKQVNLRRAVSATYYAVFHYLVHEACCAQIGTQHDQAAFRQVLGRAYSHHVMKQACASFAGGTLKESVKKGLTLGSAGTYLILKPIQRIAAAFTDLQEKRHLADYDLTERFQRGEVLSLIEEAEDRIAEFSSLGTSNDKSFFLACLWAWRELANR